MQKYSLTFGRVCSLLSKAVVAFHIPPCPHHGLSPVSFSFVFGAGNGSWLQVKPAFLPLPNLPLQLLIEVFPSVSLLANDTEFYVHIGHMCLFFGGKSLQMLSYFIYILGISHIINMTSRYSLIDFSLCVWRWVGRQCVHMRVYKYVHVVATGLYLVSPPGTLLIFFETVSLIDPRDLTWLYRLARKPLGSTCLCASQCQVTGTCYSDLAYDPHRSSCLSSKHFSH